MATTATKGGSTGPVNSNAGVAPTVEYKMPEIGVGDPVLYRIQPGAAPTAAMVLAVYARNIAVVVYPAEPGVSPYRREIVRHSGDPDLNRVKMLEGVWDDTRIGAIVRALSGESPWTSTRV